MDYYNYNNETPATSYYNGNTTLGQSGCCDFTTQTAIGIGVIFTVIVIVTIILYAVNKPCGCTPLMDGHEGFLARRNNAIMYKNRKTGLESKEADINKVQNRVTFDVAPDTTKKQPNVENIRYNSVSNGDNQEVRRKLEKTSLNNSKKIRMINDKTFLKNSLRSDNAVSGYSKANTRVNSNVTQGITLGASRDVDKLTDVTIDDKGYGNAENFVYNGNDTAAISSNSRLCGTSMDLNTIYGTMLKKYDVNDDFYKDNNPHHPELSLLKGKPLKLQYKPNCYM